MSLSISTVASHHWLGLCLLTESNRPEEWPYVAWTIRNRVESGRFRHTYESVILQPMQFSAFNKYTKTDSKIGYSGFSPVQIFRDKARGYTYIEALFHAVDLAEYVISQPRSEAPFPITVCHYWSPVSMVPRGSAPNWAKSAKKLFTPVGIDPQRFVFAEGVP